MSDQAKRDLEAVRLAISETEDELKSLFVQRRELMLTITEEECPFEHGERVGLQGFSTEVKEVVSFERVAWSYLARDGFPCYIVRRIKNDGSLYAKEKSVGTRAIVKLNSKTEPEKRS